MIIRKMIMVTPSSRNSLFPYAFIAGNDRNSENMKDSAIIAADSAKLMMTSGSERASPSANQKIYAMDQPPFPSPCSK